MLDCSKGGGALDFLKGYYAEDDKICYPQWQTYLSLSTVYLI